jgi:hypothetical protein
VKQHLMLSTIAIGGMCMLSAALSAPGPDAQPSILGLTGSVSDVRIAVPAPEKVPLLASSRPRADVELKRMAFRALNYLIHSPRKHLHYDPVFNCFVYQCPPAPVKWSGAYVRFTAHPNDELTITYPIVGFKHEVEGLWSQRPDLHMTFYWRGNMVVKADPLAGLQATPLFTGEARVLPPAPGEKK